ncbi:hypothetical protein SCHPADRAFT_885216 [Schizopora paradoxa]|uniref:Cyclase n=1 Tax=Schizopora paradoxa TaxID=27342 RepID=A0A0H2SCY0_9AGAM|nr:hypothetical protein SCHPADRAFT_885216 [Schizopora paradoxa]
MAGNSLKTAAARAMSIVDHLSTHRPKVTEYRERDWKDLPSFKELPNYKNFSGCAWGVWGEGDELGTVNLLTKDVVLEATKEIRTGETVSLNWPINFPEKPLFTRRTPEITVISRRPDYPARDDEIHMNSQSGSQWDCLRHFGVLEHHVFYQNHHQDTIPLGPITTPDPLKVDPEKIKLGVHNWANHGICGRGVFLDLVKFFTKDGTVPLPYDPWTTHPISAADITAVANAQGVQFRQGDILILRVGHIQKYYASSQEEKDRISSTPEEFAGIEQSEEMKAFLWDNHFAAIASDQPAMESWPPKDMNFMHQTILGMWGMPLGEMFDCEKLSKVCAETGRYTFFFSSWPLNILGGCASPPNAAAYF